MNTRLVEVDVVVRGKGGAIADLKQDDFTIFDQGKVQKIATFRKNSPENRFGAPVSLPPGAVSNRLDAENEEPADATVVLFDRLNTKPEDQSWAREQFLKYLNDSSARDRIAIYSVNKTLRIVQDLTSDKARLIAAANRAIAEQSVDEGAQDLVMDLPVTGDPQVDAMTQNAANEMTDRALQNRAEITSIVLTVVAQHLAGLPGRKKLVWITAAFPATYTYTGMRNLKTQIETRSYGDQIDKAARVLNDANVAVYPIDPRPLDAVDPGNGIGFGAPGIDTMNLFASKTGGLAAYSINDLSGAIRAALKDSEITYSMGFYPSSDKLDGNYHSLTVKVARSGVDLRYRKGYLAFEAKPPTDKQRKESFLQTFANPLDATGLGLVAHVQPNPDKAGAYFLDLTVSLQELHLEREKDRWVALLAIGTQLATKKRPNETLEEIKLSFTEDRLKTVLRDGYVMRRPYTPVDATGVLRVAVQDRITGLAGSVRLPLSAVGAAR